MTDQSVAAGSPVSLNVTFEPETRGDAPSPWAAAVGPGTDAAMVGVAGPLLPHGPEAARGLSRHRAATAHSAGRYHTDVEPRIGPSAHESTARFAYINPAHRARRAHGPQVRTGARQTLDRRPGSLPGPCDDRIPGENFLPVPPRPTLAAPSGPHGRRRHPRNPSARANREGRVPCRRGHDPPTAHRRLGWARVFDWRITLRPPGSLRVRDPHLQGPLRPGELGGELRLGRPWQNEHPQPDEGRHPGATVLPFQNTDAPGGLREDRPVRLSLSR